MLLSIWILTGLTFLIGCATGICCLRKRTSFPDTRTGYHMAKAMRDKESWEKANRAAGLLGIFGSIAGFLVIPALLLWLSVPLTNILLCYFFIVILFLVMILWIPLLLLKRPNGKDS